MKRAFVLLLIVFLVFSACSSVREKDNDVEGFIGGSVGLKTGLVEGAPPPSVMDGGTDPFSVVVSLENVGESNIGPGTENPFVLVRLAGLNQENPGQFGLERENLTERIGDTLSGARKNFDGTILPGEISTAIFEGLSFQYRVVGSELFRLRADVCYDYSTHATLQVCVKDDILEQRQDDTLCRLRSDLEPRNSGAPLHVTEADQNPVGDDKIQVNFVVENVGNGIFYSRGDDSDFGSCELSRQNPDSYKALVVVEPADGNNYALDCKGLDGERSGFGGVEIPDGARFGVVRLHNNAPRSLTCFMEKQTDVGGRVFQDLMNIHLYYRYSELMDIPVHVQEASGYGSG